MLEKIKNAPESSGIYQYFDENGKVLYIGKAKNLKKRIKSYFRFTPALATNPNLSPRIFKMVNEAKSISYILTKSEQDALILENSLIKQLKPKYNILLRDDKTYPYIYIDLDEPFPRFRITRKVLDGKNIKYFGPFVKEAKNILNAIYEIFKLRQRDSCKKACLFYQIEKCLAPCEERVSKEKYLKIVESAKDAILNLKTIENHLDKKMQRYSNLLKFEEALRVRELIKSLKTLNIKSELDLVKRENIDIFAIKTTAKSAVLIKIFIRDGKVISSSNKSLKINERFSIEEVLKGSLIDFYSNSVLLADTILLSNEFDEVEEIEQFLSNRFNKRISIKIPKRGVKRDLIELALLNANEYLKQSSNLLDELFNYFGFQNIPNRIEVFDNSHLFGTNRVGAMVVFEDRKFIKNSYRIYNLESKSEYEQMSEMLTRRAKAFDRNEPPDLWVIDGGSTLLNLARDIVLSVGVNIDVIAISKERIDAKISRRKSKAKDTLHSENREYKLDGSDKKLLFFQKLRDEAHRFAISSHRNSKIKSDIKLELLNVKGFGEVKVKKLLDFFGTFENIKKATKEDFLNLLNEKDSETLINYLRIKI